MSISCQILSLFIHDVCDCFIPLHENGLKWTFAYSGAQTSVNEMHLKGAGTADNLAITVCSIEYEIVHCPCVRPPEVMQRGLNRPEVFSVVLLLHPLRGAFFGCASKSVTTMMPAPCGMLFLWVIQAYSTLAFLSTGYRNTGEAAAGEPVIVSTCKILTASGGKKLKDGGSFVVPPGKPPMKVKHNVVRGHMVRKTNRYKMPPLHALWCLIFPQSDLFLHIFIKKCYRATYCMCQNHY